MIGERRASRICVPSSDGGFNCDCVRRNSYKQSPPTILVRRFSGILGKVERGGLNPPFGMQTGSQRLHLHAEPANRSRGLRFRRSEPDSDSDSDSGSKPRPKDDAVRLPPRVAMHLEKTGVLRRLKLG